MPDKDLRLDHEAVEVLLHASSTALSHLMSDAWALTQHAKRRTCFPEGLQLAIPLRRSSEDPTLSDNDAWCEGFRAIWGFPKKGTLV